MKEDIVSLKNTWVYFNDTPVLEDVTFSAKQEDFIALIGPNGGGKTTLLKIILGLLKPDKGEVEVFGKAPDQGRKSIGYLPQYSFVDLNFPINVFDVVLIGRYQGMGKRYSKDDRDSALNALKTVGMLEYKNRQIGELSSGQLQRVYIARAIARDPKLLLLDEPTASIDPEMQQSFYELLSKLKKKMAVILVTHDISVVSVYVDSVACLNRQLFYHGSSEAALKKLEQVYGCPIELLAHGVPHRVLKKHQK